MDLNGENTLTGRIATLGFSTRELAIAQQRGTTPSDLRNVVFAKINDLRQAFRELEQITEDGDTRDGLLSIINAL